MCDGGGQREHIDLSLQWLQLFSYQSSFVYFFPCLFLFHCVCLPLFAYSGFICRSLFSLVVIFTKCLVKVPAYPQIWIRFTQGLADTVSRALCFERSEEGEGERGNFFQNSLIQQFRGYLRWRSWGIPYRTHPPFFYLCINLQLSHESKQ